MTGDYYESRSEQVEAEDLPELLALLANPPKTRQAMRNKLLAILRNVALVAACGERDRTLAILRKDEAENRYEIAEIIDKPIMDVFDGKQPRVRPANGGARG